MSIVTAEVTTAAAAMRAAEVRYRAAIAVLGPDWDGITSPADATVRKELKESWAEAQRTRGEFHRVLRNRV